MVRLAWTLVASASLLLAGCADSGGKQPPEEAPTDQLGLEATPTTGIIRGLVVDDAIRPVTGVTITLQTSVPRTTETNDDGAFGFDGLEPGTYFLSATKAGFSPLQQSVDVVAGVEQPPLVKFQMVADAATAPFFQAFVFEGFIQCSVSIVAAGFAACSAAGTGQDKFSVTYELSGVPDWLQSEMVWSSTQAASDELALLYSASGETALLTNWGEARGTSPLTVQTDRALNDQWVGNSSQVFVRVFNEPIPGTNPGCVPRPVLGGCTTGLGFTLNQQFTIYTHAFYRYTPPTEWRFASGSPVPEPE